MSEMERRGGFRLNPVAALREGLERLTKRVTATGLRGVYVRPDGLVDDWHEVGASGEPAFQNGWVNFGGAEATAAFRKDGEGTVHIKGLIKLGTLASAAFTLPVGYRPLLHQTIATIAASALGRLIIFGPTGLVVPQTGSSGWFSIHITFPAEA